MILDISQNIIDNNDNDNNGANLTLPTEFDVKINHIVISGGGNSGLSFYGILRETHRKGIWKLDDIKTIYGTSIGAFLGVAISLNYDWETLDDYVIKRPWQTVFQFDVYSAIKVFQNKGIFGIKVIQDMLEPLLLGKEMTMDITMKEFYEKTGIELHCFSTEMNTFNSVDFSYKTHPDWKLVHVIYCSSSLPIVFEPWINENQCYLDGGILVDYPLNQCLLDTGAEHNTVLGIRKSVKPGGNKYNIDANSSFLDFIMTAFDRIWSRLLHSFRGDGARFCKPLHSYIVYDHPVNIQDIILTATSMEERIRLIQVGHDTVHIGQGSVGTQLLTQKAAKPPDEFGQSHVVGR